MFWTRRRILLAICAGVTLVTAGFYTFDCFAAFSWREAGSGKLHVKKLHASLFYASECRLRNAIATSRFAKTAARDPRLVFLAIDSATVSLDGLWPDEIAASPALKSMQESGWPWDRKVYPYIIDKLVKAGAKAIAFDLMFPTPRDEASDKAFSAALDRYRDKVVIGANFSDASTAGKGIEKLDVPTSALIPNPIGDRRVGYVNFWPDDDGTIRSVLFRTTENDVFGGDSASDLGVVEALSARALEQAGLGSCVPPGRSAHLIRLTPPFDGNPDIAFQPLPLYGIFVDKIWRSPDFQSGAIFKGKIVLIGAAGDWTKDLVTTAYGPESYPGPVMHLNAINAALHHDYLRKLPYSVSLFIIILAGVAAALLTLYVTLPLLRFVLLLVSMAGYLALAQLCYNRGVYVLLFAPVFGFGTSGMICLVWEQVMERLEKMRVRKTLEGLVSKNIVSEILNNPTSFLNTLGGERIPVAILFTDIRGFTTLTETLDSVQLVKQLNEYFTEMVRIVFEHRGTLDKFIGDAIMAEWGNVHTEGAASDVELAVSTGLQMQAALKKLNRGWRERQIPELAMGVGINFGEVIAGSIGSDDERHSKKDITVIGDSVNLASRLEGLTKEYHQEVILGERAAELVTDRFHLLPVDLVTVKGKTKPIQIFAPLGAKSQPLDETLRQYAEVHSAALEQYRAGRFAEAECLFRQAETIRPGDGLAELFIERCQTLQSNPPGDGWAGVFVMKTK